MLPQGGRLVAVTSANCVPGDADWNGAFAPQSGARVVFSMAIDGRVYARRGTAFETRLSVIDRSAGPGIAVDPSARAANTSELLEAVTASVPPRQPVEPAPITDLFGHAPAAGKPPARRTRTTARTGVPASAHDWGPIAELDIQATRADPAPDTAGSQAAGPYEAWRPSVVYGCRAPPRTRHRWCSPRPWPPCPIRSHRTGRCCPNA